MGGHGYPAYVWILQSVNLLFRLATFALLLYALMSWFVRPDNAFYRLLARVCQPMIAPFRPLAARLLGRGIPFDVSYLLALLALQLLQSLVVRVLSWILLRPF